MSSAKISVLRRPLAVRTQQLIPCVGRQVAARERKALKMVQELVLHVHKLLVVLFAFKCDLLCLSCCRAVAAPACLSECDHAALHCTGGACYMLVITAQCLLLLYASIAACQCVLALHCKSAADPGFWRSSICTVHAATYPCLLSALLCCTRRTAILVHYVCINACKKATLPWSSVTPATAAESKLTTQSSWS